jgi:hypothetical protein
MITTACKGCSFSEMSGNMQIGCSLGVLEKLEESGAKVSSHEDSDGTYKQVERVCMYRRYDWDWNNDIYDEVFIRSNFVVLHTNQRIQDLVDTLNSIKELDTPKPPTVIVCHTTNNLSEVYKIGTSIFPQKNFKCIQMLEINYDNSAYDEGFKRVKNGWTFFITSGDILDKDTLTVLNHAVNHEMKTFVGTSGLECYIGSVYKYLHGNQGGSVKEKLSYIDNEAVVEWSELDESYRLFQQQNA